MLKKVIVLRQDIPNIGRTIGFVQEILDASEFEGQEVIRPGLKYTRIYVNDLSEKLEKDLKEGRKKFKKPTSDDPNYAQLLTGLIQVDESVILPYIEEVNA